MNTFPWWCILTLSYFILPSLSHATLHGNDSGVPALLQFAEQYSEREILPVKTKTPPRDKANVSPSAKESSENPRASKAPRSQSGYWQIKDKEIQQQRATISQLEAQIVNLKKPQPAVPLDFSQWGKFAQTIRQALAITATEHRAKALITQAKQRWDFDKNALQRQLSGMKESNQALSDEIGNQKASLVVEKNENKILIRQQQELHHQRALMQAELDSNAGEMANLRTELSSLRTKLPQTIDVTRLKQPRLREDYAAGISLGEEILQMQQERRQWGVNADTQLILTGITDAFAGKRELTDDELNKALAAAEKRITTAREKTIASQNKSGTAYLNEFKKDKHVSQAPYGFWYRIDYAGDAKLPAKAAVDVIVKETLVDGTVIQDMGASGATLSQPIEQFPPLFREAIKLLKNHGTITFVVPPKLAYGDMGYPPKVPPNATMVYTLRIAEMYP
ncbi:FKBP-type peptidyl-prolyl cis-trans isomerase N-terminal domain-containing protein [Serratia quinivorans]